MVGRPTIRGVVPVHLVSFVKYCITRAGARTDITAFKGYLDAIHHLRKLDFNANVMKSSDYETWMEATSMITETLSIFNLLQTHLRIDDENYGSFGFTGIFQVDKIERLEREYVKRYVKCWDFYPFLVRIYHSLIEGTKLQNTYIRNVEFIELSKEDYPRLDLPEDIDEVPVSPASSSEGDMMKLNSPIWDK